MKNFQRNLARNVPDINNLQAAQEDPSYFFGRFDPTIFEKLCELIKFEFFFSACISIIYSF